MAPGMAITDPALGKQGFGLGLRKPAVAVAVEEVEELRRRNEVLEREVRERQTREEEMRRELEMTRARLRAVEEAEERLCVQLGEIEAEAVVEARDYHRRIKVLSDELEEARRILGSSSSPSPLASHRRFLVRLDGSH
ncbi:protein RESPONSE TO LOW SULFUR 3 [Elaeis guineensis]|uniref:Protein RESPONSE TO LOW SULFUR 2 n=1 Tax=Elaeis guineensis var. tenera TaxID=51953 RepID=A0A6I9QC65_ELAGV|nr:protein RESPONSE TO LOW SULFUR 2 [Elaeis guineensis]